MEAPALANPRSNPLPVWLHEALVELGLAPTACRLARRTGTAVDVGSWLINRRLWLAVVDDQLVLAAPGPRPVRWTCPVGRLSASLYNPVTGQLILVVADHAPPPVAALTLNPPDALTFLGLFRAQG